MKKARAAKDELEKESQQRPGRTAALPGGCGNIFRGQNYMYVKEAALPDETLRRGSTLRSISNAGLSFLRL